MNRRQLFALLGTSALAPAAASGAGSRPAPDETPVVLPALSPRSEDWLNSRPLTPEAPAGRVVLLEFWTFGCSNCLATLPWMKSAYARHASQGLVVIAAHAPEFDSERDPGAVARAVRRLGIEYPVLLDPQSTVWNALGNRYWPAFHLFDARGRRVTTAIGELHPGTTRAASFEAEIQGALARASSG